MGQQTYESGKAIPARFSKRGRTLQIACIKYLYPSTVEDRSLLTSYGLVYLLNRREHLDTTSRELLPVLRPLLAEMETLDPVLPVEQQQFRLLDFIGEGPAEHRRPGGCVEDCYTSKIGASPRIYHAEGCPLYTELNDVSSWTEPLPGLVRVLNPSQETLTARLQTHGKLSTFFLRPGIQEYSLPMWAELGIPDGSDYTLERIEKDQPVYRIQLRARP